MNGTRGAGRSDLGRGFWCALIGLSGFGVLCLIYHRYCLTLKLDSDDAAIMHYAQGAVLQHNPLLRHWHLTTVSFYTTDLPFFAVAMALRGFDPALMYQVPAVIFVLLLTVAAALACRLPDDEGCSPREKRFSPVCIATAFVLLGMPDPALAGSILRAPFHVGTMILLLLAFLAIDVPRNREDPSLPLGRVGVFVVLLMLALIGDTMAVFAGLIPALLVLLLRLTRRRSADDVRLFAGCLVAEIGAQAVTRLITSLGGYRLSAESYLPHVTFVSPAHFGHNLRITIHALVSLYGADFFGKPHTAFWVAVCVSRLLALVLVLYALTRLLRATFRSMRQNDLGGVDRVTAILGAAMLVDLAAYLFSTLPAGLGTTRYLTPFVCMGAVLAGRIALPTIAARPERRRPFLAILTVAGAASLAAFIHDVNRPPYDSPEKRLGLWLEAHNLHYGYGGYWCAPIVTVHMRGAVRVRQVKPLPHGNGRLAPELWASDERWFREKNARFVVVDPQNDAGVTEAAALLTFGTPARVENADVFRVMIWDRDISSRLEPLPAKPAGE